MRAVLVVRTENDGKYETKTDRYDEEIFRANSF